MADSKEYFWGCELSKDKQEIEWTFEEEEEDTDYLMHTLFLKHAVLGASAVKGERNLVSIQTKDFNDKPITQPFFSLTLGQKENCYLDLSCSHLTPVTFKLTEGSGPVYISAQQLVEFPEDANASQDFTEDEMDDLDEEEVSPKKELKITKKRKAPSQNTGKSKQRGKMDDSADGMSDEDEEEEEEDDEDEDMEDEDEDDDDEDEEEEDEEESPVKPGKKKGKKGKAEQTRKVEVKDKKLTKAAKAPPKKAAKKGKAK